jgi:GH25 family lysozyme M1 (1,4-beta-N-acetylmuramidase)
MSGKFIDISEHNTILSYGAIADSNLKGVIMKATEGTTYIDGACDINYEALHGMIPLGFYHYLTVTSDPKTQAQNFWNKIKDKEYQIIPVLDVEQDKLGDNAQTYSEQFIEEFRSLSGQEMIIYSGRCYIEEHFDYIFKKSHPWWVADYSANEKPSINGCTVVAWQFTEDCRSYAFCMGDLDVSMLEDENNFFIENFTPYDLVSTTPSSSHDIMILQNELNVQGFRDKNGNSLEVDGFAGELTLSACPMIKTGCQGNITMWVQSHVNPEMNIDGIFGELTRQAVIEYQENMSLTGDGVVGQATWSKLLGM